MNFGLTMATYLISRECEAPSPGERLAEDVFQARPNWGAVGDVVLAGHAGT